jgi:hypothetical protein
LLLNFFDQLFSFLLSPFLEPLEHGVIKVFQTLLFVFVTGLIHIVVVLLKHFLAGNNVLIDDDFWLSFASLDHFFVLILKALMQIFIDGVVTISREILLIVSIL